MAFIFLDESGQFNKSANGKYFVVGSFTIGDPRRTEKKFRSWLRTKFPKKLRVLSEIKFSQTGIDDELRIDTLRYIAQLGVQIRYVYLKRQNIPINFKQKDKIKSGDLYTSIIGELLEMYCPVAEREFRVFCDQRFLKNLTIAEFKTRIKLRLLPLVLKNTAIQIEMLDSTTSVNIQIADWISGALGRYFEEKKFGKEFYNVLKNNFLEEKELFEDYWLNKFDTTKNSSV